MEELQPERQARLIGQEAETIDELTAIAPEEIEGERGRRLLTTKRTRQEEHEDPGASAHPPCFYTSGESAATRQCVRCFFPPGNFLPLVTSFFRPGFPGPGEGWKPGGRGFPGRGRA